MQLPSRLHHARSLVLAATLLVALGACDETAPPPAGPDGGLEAAGADAVAAQHAGPPWDAPGQQVPLEAGNAIDDLNELFAFIALEEPGGFAGVHIEDGTFVIQMVEPGLAQAGAMRWIRHFFGEQLRRMPVEFRTADRSFADLMSWYTTFRSVVFAEGGPWTDTAEAENLLQAGVLPGQDQELLRESLHAAGIPKDLIALRTAERVAVTSGDLDDEFRPVVGGVNANCTVGFNAVHWDKGRGFVTAAHCTGEAGNVLPQTSFRQPAVGDTVGLEVIDPPFLTSLEGCTFSGGCRYADAAFVEYDAGVADSLGHLARPECRNCASIWVDDIDPHFKLIDEYHGLADGLTVYYVGHQTGWETGSIVQTCADFNLDDTGDDSFPPSSGLLCQFKVDNASGAVTPDKGDSGSPVFATFSSSEEVNTRLAGIQWASTVDNDDGHWWFSPITGIRNDLNPNTGLSCDGLETVAGGGCDGPDGDFQDCTGDRESFQCEADGGW